MQLDLPAPVWPGDEHVRQRGEVEHHRRARDVAAERRPRAGASACLRLGRGEHVAERDEQALLFGTSTPIALRPGIGARMRTSGDAIAYSMSLAEAGDAVDLHAGRELELVAGDGRADGRADEAGVDAELRERRLEDLAALVDQAAVGLARLLRLSNASARQLPRDFGQFVAVAARVARPRRHAVVLVGLDRGLGFRLRVCGIGGRGVDDLDVGLRFGRDEVERGRRRVVGDLVVEDRAIGLVRVVETRRRQREQRLRQLDHVRDHERHHVRDLVQAAADDQEHAENPERDQDDDGARRAEDGGERRGDERADDPARAPERVEGLGVGAAVGEVEQADHRRADEPQAEAEAPALPRAVLPALGDDRDRAEEQSNRHEHPPRPEQDGGGLVDRVPDRARQVGEDAERRDHAADGEADGQRVGRVVAQLVGQVLSDPGQARGPGLGRGPLSGRRLAGVRLTR